MYISAATKYLLSEDRNVQMEIACNPGTHPRDLAILADSPNRGIRKYVATNPSTSKETLERLMDDTDFIVRIKAATRLDRVDELNIPHYGIDIYEDAGGNLDSDEFKYQAAHSPSVFNSNAILFSYDGDVEGDPEWWVPVLNAIDNLDFDCDTAQLFVTQNRGECPDDILIKIYEAYDKYDTTYDINFKYTLAKILNPNLDLDMFTVYENDHATLWAVVIYDREVLGDLENTTYRILLRDYFFKDICEIVTYKLSDSDLADLSDDALDVDAIYELYQDYGQCQMDYTTVTGTEFREMQKGDLHAELARLMDVPVDDSVIM